MALWTDPYYSFSLENKVTGKPVRIDVTSSAGNFESEIAGLADLTTDFKERGVSGICDFGAGKLRNTLFLLRAGFAVCAVEHVQTFQRPQGKVSFAAANRFKHFRSSTPKAFHDGHAEYNAVLLINVVNVIPDLSDRKEVIRACADRLQKDGLLIWMTHYGEPHYRRGAATRMRIADGYCYNLTHEHQTFVKEFTIPEIRDLLPHTKLREVRQLNVRYHHAFLYERR